MDLVLGSLKHIGKGGYDDGHDDVVAIVVVTGVAVIKPRIILASSQTRVTARAKAFKNGHQASLPLPCSVLRTHVRLVLVPPLFQSRDASGTQGKERRSKSLTSAVYRWLRRIINPLRPNAC